MKNLIRSTRSKFAPLLTAVLAMVASFGAMATSTGIGQDAATAVSGAGPQVELVQTALIGVLVLLVIFALVRRSMGK